MPNEETQRETPAAVKTVAGIDIGSSSLRMSIAEVTPDGKVETIDQFQRTVRLGQDTFRRGRLGGQTMRAAISILRDYRKSLDFYSVRMIRAVATSAVRESRNADTFIDRVFIATGLDVDIIDTSEESRLIVSAVSETIGEMLSAGKGNALIAEVGGGSTLLALLEDGEIAAARGLNLGSVRLQEALATVNEPPERAALLYRNQIRNAIAALQNSFPLKKIKTFVALGRDARFAARQVGKPMDTVQAHVVRRGRLDKLLDKCLPEPPEQLVKLFGMPIGDAEMLNPALLVYQALMKAAQVKQIIVSQVSMVDGLLLDLARSVTGKEDETLNEGVIHSATTIAEKYRVDLKHARSVANLAVRLFDELQNDHGLSARHRLLLHAAGLTHEVGGFVSSRAHHKHSYYLMANAEIFGLTRDEVIITALVGRYHRRSAPKPTHIEYMSLPREKRMVVTKLAALLRVADALDRAHAGKVRDFTCERRDDELVLRLPGVADLTLERRAMRNKADLFEDVFGMRVRLEEAQVEVKEDRRAKAVE